MTPKTTPLTPELYDYAVAHGTPPDEIQSALIAETREKLADNAGMQISPDQGAFLTTFVRALGVSNAIEVGTFTGYSALCIARGLREGGQLVCCDISEEFTSVARRYWDRAGVSGVIDLRIGPAVETLRAMPSDPVVDFAFVDADKPGYVDYWELLVPRLRPGGVMLVDNVFYHGTVVDPTDGGENVRAIRAFNEHAAADDRVDLAMLTIADGITFARKR